MKIKEIYTKFKLKTDNIPQTILNIEIEEDIKNFTKHQTKNNITYFTGEYKPNWYNGKGTLQITLKIDLTTYTNNILENINELPQIELTPTERQQILTGEPVTYTETITDNFTSLKTYNIFGELTRIS